MVPESPIPKIILVGPYPPPAGGMAHHVKALLELTKKEGIGAVVFDINKNSANNVIPIAGRKELSKKIIASPAKCVHIHADSFDLHYHVPVAILAAKISKKVAITSIHSGNTGDYYISASTLKKLLIKYVIRKSDLLILDNNLLEKFVKSLGRKKETFIISPFVSSDLTFENLPEALDEFAKKSRPLFMSCGNPRAVYQFDKVIAAFAGFVRDNPTAGLVITQTDESDEKGWQKLKEAAERFEVGARIRFEAGLSHEQFLELLRRADAFIRFTTHDGDSLSVREALALGVPVIATDTGARPDGVVLVKTFDETALMGAMRNVEKFSASVSIKNTYDEFVRLYKGLMGKQKNEEE